MAIIGRNPQFVRHSLTYGMLAFPTRILWFIKTVPSLRKTQRHRGIRLKHFLCSGRYRRKESEECLCGSLYVRESKLAVAPQL